MFRHDGLQGSRQTGRLVTMVSSRRANWLNQQKRHRRQTQSMMSATSKAVVNALEFDAVHRKSQDASNQPMAEHTKLS
jgi:hypothetical protein